ncbi:hypothetical protein NECAME_02956 [Necator americanus]|uniref:RRM domain-containing protein n=1 Tax=Necator americanus TaxID=51031 RepID=W2T8D7_NECAM|nr:hypothetical protein NECAME_02956 [Necator americanus]ETN78250.1 hypothetical protein NECAME_02956 [Necator americanus]
MSVEAPVNPADVSSLQGVYPIEPQLPAVAGNEGHGRAEKVYPSDMNITSSTTSKCAFIKYDDDRAVEVGQHLTNTVLIDRAIVCAPFLQSTIPDEATFINSGGPVTAGQRQLPPHVTNKVQELEDGSSVLLTVDPQMEALGLPAYPPLPGNTDLAKVEEIRRTIYVGNLPKGVDGQAVLDFFNNFVGEVMYLRMATGPETLPCAYAYIEFTNQTSVPIALQNNGIDYQGRPLRIQHSRVAIIKPQAKSADQALEEVEEAIRMGKKCGSTFHKTLLFSLPSFNYQRTKRTAVHVLVHLYAAVVHHPHVVEVSRHVARGASHGLETEKGADRDREIEKEAVHATKSAAEVGTEGEVEAVIVVVDVLGPEIRSANEDAKRDRSSDRKKEKEKDKKEKEKSKEAKVEDLDEETLRERLLEKAAVRSGKEGSESDHESEADKGDKTPSKIKNERKRRRSDSD